MTERGYRSVPAADRPRLPPRLEQQLERELEPAERVVWAGRPSFGWALRQSLPLFLFGVPWTAFSLLFLWVSRAEWITSCFLTPFVLLGVVLLTSPVWEPFGAAGSFYAVTDRRALTALYSVWRRRTTVRSFPPEAMGPVRLTARRRDGDVVFAVDRVQGEGGMEDVPVGFLGTRDAGVALAHVERLVREAEARRTTRDDADPSPTATSTEPPVAPAEDDRQAEADPPGVATEQPGLRR